MHMIRYALPLLLMLAVPVRAGENIPASLAGKPFHPYTQDVPMPPGWDQKPIAHPLWAKDADIAGNLDQQFYPFLAPLMEEFGQKNGLKVVVTEGTCGTAEGMLRKRTIDVGGFCCPPAVTDRLPGLTFHTLGIQAVAILVHADNPVDNLTMDQVRLMFQNKIENWNQLKRPDGTPGPDLKIRPILRPHCDARPGHWRVILDTPDLFGPRVTDVGSISDMILSVAGNSGAIGYEEMPTARRFEEAARIRAVRIDGASPDNSEDLATHRYPFYQIYNLTLWEKDPAASAKAREMVEFLKSRVKSVDPDFHFVSAEKLRQSGWKFTGPELTGEPE